MKKYDKPLITNFTAGGFAVPAIAAGLGFALGAALKAALVGGAAAAGAAAGAAIAAKAFKSSDENSERIVPLEPVIA